MQKLVQNWRNVSSKLLGLITHTLVYTKKTEVPPTPTPNLLNGCEIVTGSVAEATCELLIYFARHGILGEKTVAKGMLLIVGSEKHFEKRSGAPTDLMTKLFSFHYWLEKGRTYSYYYTLLRARWRSFCFIIPNRSNHLQVWKDTLLSSVRKTVSCATIRQGRAKKGSCNHGLLSKTKSEVRTILSAK